MNRRLSYCVPVLFLFLLGAGERKTAKDVNVQALRQSAQAMGDAFRAGDSSKIVDSTYPKVIELMGGRERMIEIIKGALKGPNGEKIEFTAFQVGTPEQVTDADSDIVAILPETLKLTIDKTKMTLRSYLIAISSDQGKTWTFIDGAGVNNESVKQIYPKFPAQIKLPEKQKATVDKE